MGLAQQVIEDIKQITANLNDWGIPIQLIAPTKEIANIVGLHTKHHLSLSPEGIPMNSKNASIAISEGNIPVGYPFRNTNGEVRLKGHKCNVVDSTGIIKNYIIREWFPDESVGLIVCILGDFE